MLFLRKKRKRNMIPFEKGYILLFTIFVSAVVSVIGLSILNVVKKEIILSAESREAQFAFYVADSGVECGLHWDIQHPGYGSTVFATSTASNPPGLGDGVTCAGSDIFDPNPPVNYRIVSSDASSAVSEFTLVLPGDLCSLVTVTKTGSGATTNIEGRGTTFCSFASHPQKVQRALEATF